VSAVVVVTPEELADLVRGAVRAELAARAPADPKEVLTLNEVAALLDRHPKVVMGTLVKKRGLPCRYISDHEPRFYRAEVLAWLDGQPKKPPAQLTDGASDSADGREES
jgi:hypothetical protein